MASISGSGGDLWSILAMAESRVSSLSTSTQELGQDIEMRNRALSVTENTLRETTAFKNNILRAQITRCADAYHVTPLGLCFQLLPLKSLCRASGVCKEWHKVSLDYVIQLKSWSAHLAEHDPALYAKYASISDKREMIAEAKASLRTASIYKKLHY